SIPFIGEDISTLFLVYGKPDTNRQVTINLLKLYPQDSTIWQNLAILDANAGNSSEAKAAISKAAQYGQVPSDVYNGIMSDEPFGITPKVFNAVNMVAVLVAPLIVAVVYPVVFVVPHVDQAVVASPAV